MFYKPTEKQLSMLEFLIFRNFDHEPEIAEVIKRLPTHNEKHSNPDCNYKQVIFIETVEEFLNKWEVSILIDYLLKHEFNKALTILKPVIERLCC
jgi:hypothetical protein